MGKRVVHFAIRVWGRILAKCAKHPDDSATWETRWGNVPLKKDERWCKRCVPRSRTSDDCAHELFTPDSNGGKCCSSCGKHWRDVMGECSKEVLGHHGV